MIPTSYSIYILFIFYLYSILIIWIFKKYLTHNILEKLNWYKFNLQKSCILPFNNSSLFLKISSVRIYYFNECLSSVCVPLYKIIYSPPYICSCSNAGFPWGMRAEGSRTSPEFINCYEYLLGIIFSKINSLFSTKFLQIFL